MKTKDAHQSPSEMSNVDSAEKVAEDQNYAKQLHRQRVRCQLLVDSGGLCFGVSRLFQQNPMSRYDP
jgi:hypothetical protein